jgi:Fe-S-cluster-containing dehydrogenase component
VTATRLDRLADLKRKESVQVSTKEPVENVLYDYAFNVSRCEGYMDCVEVCIKWNDLDRKEETQHVRIFEMEHGRSCSQDRPFLFVTIDKTKKPQPAFAG